MHLARLLFGHDVEGLRHALPKMLSLDLGHPFYLGEGVS